MVGDVLQVPVVVAHGRVHVEAQIAGVEVVVERRDQGLVAGLRGGWNLLEVERDPAIVRVGGQERVDLLDEVARADSFERKSPIGG